MMPSLSKPCKTDPELLRLLEEAAKIPMTPEMYRAQRRSWVRGELGLQGYTDDQIAQAMQHLDSIGA